jgi:hypothetical protein
MRVAILGCGPAGLAAAHAAVGLRSEVTVFAPKRKTPQHGPLLLQRPIPGINTDHPDGTIHQIVVGGSILDYRYKLYGDINIGINGDILTPHYNAWQHRETYDRLWNLYNDRIVDDLVTPYRLSLMHNDYDLVVSTANARTLCRNPPHHHFVSKAVAVTPKAEYEYQPDNTIIFNADPDVPWVRSSRIFGVEVTEWPIESAPAQSRIIEKPISTGCICYPHVLRTGRFGAFKNEVWIDTAYNDVFSAIDSMRRGDEIARIR